MDTERIQRTATYIILGQEISTYKGALDNLCLDSLDDRRMKICTTFANKANKHPKFSRWFSKHETTNTEHNRTCKVEIDKPFLKPVVTRTDRYRRSPIPYLTSLLNKQAEDNKKK